MSKPYGVVYCLTFPDGKRYFGATKQFLPRMSQHKRSAQNPTNAVSNAILEFGWANVKKEIVSECSDRSELDFMEGWFISLYGSIYGGYNVQRGRERKISEEEELRIRSKCSKGKKRTQELKDRMRQIFLKKKEAGEIPEQPPMSEEDKKKWSEMNSGKNNPTYNHDEFIFKHDETGEVFRGTRHDFRIKTQASKGQSSALVLGRQKTSKGWSVIEGPIK